MIVKNSDTLIIYGSGSSINNLSNDELKKFNDYDSISVNLFIKTKIPLKFYILGEGLSYLLYSSEKNLELKKKYKNEYDEYIKILKNYYEKTKILLVTEYYHPMNFLNPFLKKIKEDLKDNTNILEYKVFENFSFRSKDNHLHHSGCGINCCINFGIKMGYKNILFVGVDLYDQKYCYDSINSKILKKNENSEHTTKNTIFNHINKFKRKVNFFTYNEKSILTKVIPIFKKEIYFNK